jgi:hypothetical protein
MPQTFFDERILRHINNNIAQGLTSDDLAQRQASARTVWQLASMHNQPDGVSTSEMARTRQLALSAITKVDLAKALAMDSSVLGLVTAEEAKQRYIEFTNGKLALQPQESLALRGRVIQESKSQYDLMPALSSEEVGWLAQQAEIKQRALSHAAIAVAGPSGFMGAIAAIRHAPPEVINNMTAIGVGFSGGFGGQQNTLHNSGRPARLMNTNHEVVWKIVGEGHVPPNRVFRDLSNQPVFDIHPWRDAYEFFYRPEGALQHFMFGGVDQKGVLRFAIRAGESRQQYGTGAEMFLSVTYALEKLNVNVRQIDSVWEHHGAMSSNHKQLWENLDKGMSPKQAALQTFTGRMASQVNLREVSFSQKSVNAIHSGDRSVNIEPSFSEQDLGLGAQWQNYGHCWVDAMGRSKMSAMKAPQPADAHQNAQDYTPTR